MEFIAWTIDLSHSLKFLFFEFEGRIGRTAYAAGQIGAVVSFLTFSLILPVLIISVPEKGFAGAATVGFWLYISLWCLLYLWSFLALSVKRCHDFGESGSHNLFRIAFWPAFSFELIFREGDLGRNGYGHRRGL